MSGSADDTDAPSASPTAGHADAAAIADPDADGTLPPGYLAGGGQVIGTTAPAELPLRGWPRAPSAMRSTDYRRIWSGALVSNIGSWMQNVARDWLVFQLGGPAGKFYLGLNAFAEGVPLVLLLPWGGVLADRLNRKAILVVANFASAALSVALAVLAASGRLRGWHIVAFTAAQAALDALRIPANQAMLPDLVPRRDVSNSIALNSLQFNLSRVLGPALGGLTLFYLGAAWSFSLNAVSFLAVIIPLLMIGRLPPLPVQRHSVGRTLAQGVGYIRSRPDLITMMMLVVLGGLFTAPVTKMLPALASDVYGRGEGGFSILLSAFGAGAVVGAGLLAVRSHRDPTPWRAFALLTILSVCEVLLGFNRSFPLGLALVAAAGMLFIGTMVRLNTAIIHSTPAAVRGRVTSFHVLAFRLGLPVGGLLAGWIAQWLGVRWSFWGFGAAMLVAMPALMVRTRGWRDGRAA